MWRSWADPRPLSSRPGLRLRGRCRCRATHPRRPRGVARLPPRALRRRCLLPDLEELQVVRVQGTYQAGRTTVRIVGKFFSDTRSSRACEASASLTRKCTAAAALQGAHRGEQAHQRETSSLDNLEFVQHIWKPSERVYAIQNILYTSEDDPATVAEAQAMVSRQHNQQQL